MDSTFEPQAQIEEAEAMVALLAAECIHEVTHTLNYLRFSSSQAVSSAPGADTNHFAQIEVERLHRLLSHLRRYKLSAPDSKQVMVREVLDECIHHTQLAQGNQHFQLEATVDPDVFIQTDPSFLSNALQHLLLHAAAYTRSCDTVTLIAEQNQSGTTIQLSHGGAAPLLPEGTPPFNIWDLWPPGQPASHRILAYCLLRHIGWTLRYERRDDQNLFICTAPPELAQRA